MSNAMKFAWEALIHYLCFEILASEYEKDDLRPAQRDQFEKIRNGMVGIGGHAAFSDGLKFLAHMGSVEMARRHAFFGYALSRALQFVSALIERAPNTEANFEAYLIENLIPEHYFIEIFGQEFLAQFYEIVDRCERKFLIALDGFDSNFQSFRVQTFRSYRDTEFFYARTRFEQDWLSGLIAAVRRCKRRKGTSPLSGKVDFCVTIPKDRFLEFVEDDGYATRLQHGVDGGELWWLCCGFGADAASGRPAEPAAAGGKRGAWRAPLVSSPIDIPTRVFTAARCRW
jgi:hypothetical protein